MLLAFYPVVSPANFARARSERPEYFGGGTITRAGGDKIQLPDGRIYDCIINSGGRPGTTFWTCSLVDPNAPPVDDPFALEEGPLAFLDEDAPIFPDAGDTFTTLVSGHLGDLDGSDAQLTGAATPIVTFDGPAQLEASAGANFYPAVENHVAIAEALTNDNPADVAVATGAQAGTIADQASDYDDEPPADLPVDDPGDPPGDGPPKQPPAQ